MQFTLLVLLSAYVWCVVPQGNPSLVHIPDGALRGIVREESREFRAVPFAKPPVGDLRWRPPQKNKGWSGIRDATKYSQPCHATDLKSQHAARVVHSEDCLYLNVYAPLPPVDNTTRYPVLFWIHGGGYTGGSANAPYYDGHYLVEKYKHVIVVTVNYRLNIFGFLGAEQLRGRAPDKSTGNYGILDQRAGLQWVQENIQYFYGAADQVTISGESAGAGSTTVHVTSPASWPYFARAALSSGASTLWGANLFSSVQNKFDAVVQHLKCENVNSTLVVQCLLAKTPTELTKSVSWNLFDPYCRGHQNTAAAVDGVVLTDQPWVLASQGKLARKPLLVGSNHDEGSFFGQIPSTDITSTQREEWINKSFGSHLYTNISNLYAVDSFEHKSCCSKDYISADMIATDSIVACATRRMAHWNTQFKSKAWLYQFARGPGGIELVTHGVDVPYVFHVDPLLPLAADKRVADTLGGYWTNFVKSGDPNVGYSVPAFPQYSSGSDVTQIVNVTTYSAKRYKAKFCSFWDQLALLNAQRVCQQYTYPQGCDMCPPV